MRTALEMQLLDAESFLTREDAGDRALSGVRSGSGHRPSISKYCWRNSGRRASHCARLVMPSRN